MDDKKDPWADFNKQIENEREKENELIKKRYSKEKLVKIALNFALKQDFQKALDYFKLVTEKDPKHFLAWVNMGIIYTYHNLLGTDKGRRTAYYKRHYDEGINCFKKALELKPNNIPTLIGLGDAFRGKKEFTKSIEYFEKILKIDSKNSESRRGIGFAYLEMMEFENAIDYFEKALKIENNNVDCWIGLGISYFEKKDLDKSLNCFINALNYQKQQEKPKKDIIGREIYSNKLETVAKIIYYIESEKANLNFVNEIEKDFNIKFENKPSILKFFEETSPKTANQDLISEEDEELTQSNSKDIKMDRISVLERKLLTSENENERLTAATELKKIKKEKARLALLKAYKDKSRRIRTILIETIENAKDIENAILIPYLVKLLDDESVRIREKSIKILGKIGNSEILPYFLKKLIDPNKWVRAYAVEAIGEFGNDKAVKYLVSCLGTEIPLLVEYITWALGQIYPRLIKEPLRKNILNLLIAFLQNDKLNLNVRSQAAIALGNIAGEEAFKAISETLNSLTNLNSRNFSKDQINFYKCIIESIGYFKDKNPTDLLITILKNELQKGQKASKEEEIILSTIESLGVIGDNKATELLMKTLYELNEKIRLASVKALVKLHDNDLNERVISILIDDTEKLSFKKAILSTIIEIYKEDLVPLINILKNIKDLTVEEQIKKDQRIIIIKNEKDLQIGKISYQLLDEEIKEIEEKKKEEVLEEIKNLEIKIKEHNLKNYVQSLTNASEISNIISKRNELLSEINTNFNKYKSNEKIKQDLMKLINQLYSPYFEINPFKVDLPNFASFFKGLRDNEINRLKAIAKDNIELENLWKKLENVDYNSMKNQELKKISEETNEYTIDVHLENLYKFLLDFSEVLPLGVGTGGKTEDSTETDYTIKTYFGLLMFKIIEKDVNKKIIYEYDFSKSDVKEIGKLYLDFIDHSPGKVKLRVKNEIYESSGTENYLNWIGNHLKQWIDYNLGKIVAKQIQTLFYEKAFDDLTMGNYRILQAKLNAIGKDIDKLKTKYFEVKAPLSLTSFNCSECGATLKITSKEEKFIICEHCDTPFLMEWQKD
ncbi:MAG: HEAT repeat domain-containing protein [Candidatus Hermodarchaeota archaeon]